MKKLKHIKWFNVILFLFVMVGLLSLAQLFILPNMEEWDIDRVQHYEAANDIKIDYDYVYSNEHEYGQVIDQVKCEKEEPCDISLTISKGKDFTSKSSAQIKEYLDGLIEKGIILANEVNYHESMYSNTIDKDMAIYYEPNPYLNRIDVSFSLGPEVHIYKSTMVGAGDVLLHDTVFNDFRVEGNLFDFSPLLEDIKGYIEPADFAFVNQETNIGGAEIGLSSYPNFNSPYEIATQLRDIGFNMFSRANNHTLDKGENGILSAQKHWETLTDIIYAGSTDSQVKADVIPVLEQNGIKVSMLAYSYGFNGYKVPKDKPYLANEFNYETAEMEIAKAKEISDVIVVSMHWGNEYQSLPSELQLEQAQWLADQGVHIIMGHHPHVIQPVDKLIGVTGNETLVAYSLGNFISGQTGLEKRVGSLIKFDITKTVVGDETSIEISIPQFMPTYNYPEYKNSRYKIVPLIESSERDYFETVKTLLETYSDKVEVVEYLNYNQ
ncbi:MAG: CapA family protein [Turicibacter sp.]